MEQALRTAWSEFTGSLGTSERVSYIDLLHDIREVMRSGDVQRVLHLLEVAVRAFGSQELVREIATLLDQQGAPFWLDESNRQIRFRLAGDHGWIGPLRRSLEAARSSGFSDAAEHLEDASDALRAERFRQAMANSMLALESAARELRPDAPSLKQAVLHLQSGDPKLHAALTRIPHYVPTDLSFAAIRELNGPIADAIGALG